MQCIICNSKSSYYFSKTYTEKPIDEFMKDIGPIQYYKCENCGFVLSKTHLEMGEEKWNELNLAFHHYMENPEFEKSVNQPPYAEQAMMLTILGKNGVIDTGDVLDYAAGYGTLSKILSKYNGIEINIFDQYVQADGAGRYVNEADLRKYKTVVNSAMFEHVLRREDLDRVNSMVDIDGCMIIHSVVCERVPDDPDWFYLNPPVHTAFHTNKSMGILMEQWGYKSSLYCPQAKCWVLLKEEDHQIEQSIDAINKELQTRWFYWKSGFVDYWKGF